MFRKWKKRRMKETGSEYQAKTVSDLFRQLKDQPDFIRFQHKGMQFSCWISFFDTLIDVENVHRDILPHLYSDKIKNLTDVQTHLPAEKMIRTKDPSIVRNRLLEGYLIIQAGERDSDCLVIPSVKVEGRQVSLSQIESSIIGPKESFVESLDKNTNLIRKRVPIPQLTVQHIRVGKLSRTRVSVIYIQGIANEENVNTVKQRIAGLEVANIEDTTALALNIRDNNASIFPQFIDTERPDRAAAALYEGKIAVLADGSPNALILPSTIVEFFIAFDDYYLPWQLASAYRLLRLFAVAISILSTSFYVALLTYHFQLIPKDLLGSLVSSRSSVPFDPIVEVLILEVMIELLREAGARLPTKVGQTIGIVGGIVIGTATVQAGLTSNILLITVAMSALAAFITPNYRMATTIRFIRFPFIISAQIFGLLGIALCFSVCVGHLLRMTSLGRPYMEPIYPLRVTDLKDSFIRLPLNHQNVRPMLLRPGDAMRMNSTRTHRKKGKNIPDIDE
ncbi:spore germination protein [Sporolactobacillus sp. Y61]|uniref:Spore germination protein n=1 Tax=Sporolactobacillus sp. Y61 TaxID=3160863 RepID=A0AAU8IEZ1_9BACL